MTATVANGQRPFWMVVLFYSFFLTDSMNWLGVFFGLDFRLGYVLAGIAIVFFAGYGRLVIPRAFIWFLLCVIALSILASGGRDDVFVATLIQIVGILFFALVAFNVTKRLDLQQATEAYLVAAKIVAASILFEQFVFLIGGHDLVNFVFLPLGGVSASYVVDGVLRASGVLYEPSQVGLLLAPALYLALKTNDRQSVGWVSLGTLGSFSGLAFVGTAVAILFFNMNFRRLLKTLPFLLIFFPIFFISTAVQDRVNKVGTIFMQDSLSENDPSEINALQGSVGGMYINSLVLLKGLEDSPLIGHGLGSFAVLFNEYLGNTIDGADRLSVVYPGQGKSLLIRLLFEFGLLGMVIFLIFFYRRWGYIYKNKESIADGELRLSWAVASIVFFIIYMIRKDAYVSFYIWFFFFMFVHATKHKSH